MIRHALFALLMLPGIASAVICKTIGPDGEVSYANIPAAVCPETISVPGAPPTVKPPPPETRPQVDSGTPRSEVPFRGYTSMTILQPTADESVRSNEGIVSVSIALEPALQPGHLVRLFVDGNAVEGEFDGLAIQLRGVERGMHSLRAQVVDNAGRRRVESAPVSFMVRQTGLFERAPPRPVQPLPRENPR